MTDPHANSWFDESIVPFPSTAWKDRMEALLEASHARGLKVYLGVASLGHCNHNILLHDANLATGYPVKVKIQKNGYSFDPDHSQAFKDNHPAGDDSKPLIGTSMEGNYTSDNIMTELLNSDAPKMTFSSSSGEAFSIQIRLQEDLAYNTLYRVSATLTTRPEFTFSSNKVLFNIYQSQEVQGHRSLLTKLGEEFFSYAVEGDSSRKYSLTDSMGDPVNFAGDGHVISTVFSTAKAINDNNYHRIPEVTIGLRGGDESLGTLEISDMKIEHVPMLNTLKRGDGYKNNSFNTYFDLVGTKTTVQPFNPVIVGGREDAAGEVTYTSYLEGKDFYQTNLLDNKDKIDSYRDSGELNFYSCETEGTTDPCIVSNHNNTSYTYYGHSALVIRDGQIGCSWNDPGVYERMTTIFNEANALVDSSNEGIAGYLIPYDEVRTGGFEPRDLIDGWDWNSTYPPGTNHLSTARQALDKSIQTSFDTLKQVVGDKPLFIWGDMLNPNQNAIDDYYIVNRSLEGQITLPDEVTVLNWAGTVTYENFNSVNYLDDMAANVSYFTGSGTANQMIAAYYDPAESRSPNVSLRANYDMWHAEIKQAQQSGNSSTLAYLTGVIYSSWKWNENDYGDTDEFSVRWFSNCFGKMGTLFSLDNEEQAEYLHGTEGNDVMIGTDSGDKIHAGNGYDFICGLSGNDTLNGGNGSDFIIGNDGNDTIYGDIGNDNIRGGSGADVLYGGPGNDTIYQWSTYLSSDGETDRLNGGDGSDTCHGLPENDLYNSCELRP